MATLAASIHKDTVVTSRKPVTTGVRASQVDAVKWAADRRIVAAKPAKSAGTTAPGEDVRNTLSIFNMLMAPLVTFEQSLGMLGKATFKSPLLRAGSRTLLNTAEVVGVLPLLRQPVMRTGLKAVGRFLPILSATLLCFDGYAMFHTFKSAEASGLRKALTAGRFVANAIAAAASFIPGAGMVYAMIPNMVGNVFEISVMRMNMAGRK